MNTMHAMIRAPRGLLHSAGRVAPAIGLLLGLALLGPTATSHAQGFAGGDSDTVGSLPIEEPQGPTAGTHGVDPTADGGVQWSDHFRMRMVGSKTVLDSLFIDADGTGYVLEQKLDDQGTVAYTFVGDVRVVLDRQLLERSFVTLEVAIGPVFTGGRSVVQAGPRKATQVLHAGTFDLHLRQLAKSGLTDAGVHLEAWSRHRLSRGQNASLNAKAGADTIVLVQRPTPAAR